MEKERSKIDSLREYNNLGFRGGLWAANATALLVLRLIVDHQKNNMIQDQIVCITSLSVAGIVGAFLGMFRTAVSAPSEELQKIMQMRANAEKTLAVPELEKEFGNQIAFAAKIRDYRLQAELSSENKL